jgi:hypothetical protein
MQSLVIKFEHVTPAAYTSEQVSTDCIITNLHAKLQEFTAHQPCILQSIADKAAAGTLAVLPSGIRMIHLPFPLSNCTNVHILPLIFKL